MSAPVPFLHLQHARTTPLNHCKQVGGGESISAQPLTCRQSSSTVKLKEQIEPASQSTKRSRTKLPDIYQPRFFRRLESKQNSRTTKQQKHEYEGSGSKMEKAQRLPTLPRLVSDPIQTNEEHKNFRKFIRRVLSRRRDLHRRTDSNEAAHVLQPCSPRERTHRQYYQPHEPLHDGMLCLELDLSRIQDLPQPPTPTPDSLQLIQW